MLTDPPAPPVPLTPAPPRSDTAPPTLLFIEVTPATSDIDPPCPASPLPTARLMDPPAPPVAPPVEIETLPLEPTDPLEAVCNLRAPLDPPCSYHLLTRRHRLHRQSLHPHSAQYPHLHHCCLSQRPLPPSMSRRHHHRCLSLHYSPPRERSHRLCRMLPTSCLQPPVPAHQHRQH